MAIDLRAWEWIRGILYKVKGRPDVVPATEPVNRMACRGLARGSSYIIEDSKTDFGLEVFTSLVKGKCLDCDHSEAFPCESIGCKGCTLTCPCKSCSSFRAQGLCFTTRSPEEIRQRFTLQTTPIFWISNRGENHVSPTAIELAADIINKFLLKSDNPVVIVDGVEYLIVVDGFVPVLKFLRDIQEGVVLNKGIFIMPINPAALEEKEFALIERDMKTLTPQSLKEKLTLGTFRKDHHP